MKGRSGSFVGVVILFRSMVILVVIATVTPENVSADSTTAMPVAYRP